VAVLGEVQGVLPAILGAAAALDKAPAFEVVDQGDEAAGVDAEVRRRRAGCGRARQR